MKKRLFITAAVSILAMLCANLARAAEYPFTPELTVSNFSIRKLPVAEQAKTFVDVGARSMWVRLYPNTIRDLKAFRQTPEVQSGELSIGIVRLEMKVDWAYDSERLKPLFEQLQALDLPLWVFAKGKAGDREKAVALFTKFCEQAADYDVDIVIYPHSGQIFHNALQSLELIEELPYDHLKLAVMWCHEVNSGVHLDIATIMDKVAPHLAIAAISGADEQHFEQNRGSWKYGIMPLDRGDIEATPFLDALAKHNYQGPILLKCWGIQDEASDHIPRSLKKWEAMIQPYAK